MINLKRLIVYSLCFFGLLFFKNSFHTKKINKVITNENLKELSLYKNEYSKISDIKQVLDKLNKSDQKWRPKKIINNDGSITYTYNKFRGELNLTLFK